MFASRPARIACQLLGLLATVPLLAQQAPPAAPVRAVVDTYYGVPITDNYRWMESGNEAELDSWMKGQNNYTRSLLDRIPGRDALKARIEALSQAGTQVYSLVRAGNEFFYLKLAPGDEIEKLYVRDGLQGTERLLVDPARLTTGETHFALDYFVPSLDGKYLAYGVSPGGSEESVLHVMEIATGQVLGDSITRARFGAITWLPDGRSFFYNRLQPLAPDAPPTDKYMKSRIYRHLLGRDAAEDPEELGNDLSSRMEIPATDLPIIAYSPASTYAIALDIQFVRNEVSLYAAPLAQVNGAQTPWRKVTGFDDDVTRFDVHGNDLYLLSHHGASRYQVLRVSLSDPDLSKAEVVVPAGEAVLTNLGVAKDALYVQELDGGIGRLLRVTFGAAPTVQKVALPFQGSISEFVTDARQPGILLKLTGWTEPQLWYRYDPATGKTTDTGLRPRSPVDFSGIESREVKAKSADGTMVPLSIIMKRGMALDGSHPTQLEGYGSYGITMDPGFNPVSLAWLERGGIIAVAHVRGGGEYGEDWHLGGQKLTKQNTISDFIACAEYLIAAGYTSPKRLSGQGGSAGGITIGGAITQRPELFGAAIDNVGMSDALRVETTPNGPPNIPEFGSVTTEDGFKGLYSMSAFHHVKDSTAYPAVLLTTGINDPRVAPWEMAKMTARLQAATSSGKPILLRVDFDAGHGIGSTREQNNAELADEYSFLFWQLGDPEFQPVVP